ncbi:hypothetical protein V2O64_17065 [Verrucomicrobiaceae bacterium 227]
MGAQRKIVIEIIHQGADDLLALKGNQETLLDEVKVFLEDPGSLKYAGEKGAVVTVHVPYDQESMRAQFPVGGFFGSMV